MLKAVENFVDLTLCKHKDQRFQHVTRLPRTWGDM